MSIKIESCGAKGQYMVGGDGFLTPKYSINKENVKQFAEEYNSINTTRTAQNAAVGGIIGTLSVFGAAKFAKKIPLIAKIPLSLLAFCAASMLACIPNNWFAGKKIEETAQKYSAEKIIPKKEICNGFKTQS